MSSFNTVSTQRQNLQTANTLKKSVLDKAKRFHKLDGVEGADANLKSNDEVIVERGNATPLPSSTGNDLARLAVGILAPKEAQPETTGYSKGENGNVVTSDITTHVDGKETDFQYKKSEDGTEIFHGPTDDGFAVVVENKSTGLLIMKEAEHPLRGTYDSAGRGEYEIEASQDEAEAPRTF